MTEGQQDALPVVEQTPAGKPTPQVLGGSPEAGSVAAGPDANALVREVAELKERLARLPDEIDARFKSGKDKRFAKVEEILEWAKASGGDVAKIKEPLERQALVDRIDAIERGQPSPDGVHGGTPEKSDDEKVAKFLNDLKDESGVELTDEELHQIWDGKRYTGPTGWDDAFRDARKAAFKKAKGETIVASSVVAEGGKTAPVQGDLVEKYKSDMLAARGQGASVGRSIKNKYRQLGVDVDSINLTEGPIVAERDPRREKVDYTRK